MATSGTTSFTLSVDEIIAAAVDRIGGETTTGYELRAARRVLGLFLLDLGNRGINLWSVERGEMALVGGQAEYTLAADTVDWLDAALCRDGTDTAMERISVADYQRLAVKSTEGRPARFLIERPRGAPVLTLYPVPENSTDTIKYRRTRRLEDAGAMTNELDVPPRFYPAVISGLAWFMGEQRPSAVDAQRRGELKARYEEDLSRAQEEDRERVSLFIRPGRRR